MVQILPQRGFEAGLEQSLPLALEQLLGNIQEGRSRKKEDVALDRLGIDIEGIRDPAIRKQLLQGEQARDLQKLRGEQDIGLQTLKGTQATQKTQAESEVSLQENQSLGKYFGPEFAELHGALGTGEQTKFFEQVLESHQTHS